MSSDTKEQGVKDAVKDDDTKASSAAEKPATSTSAVGKTTAGAGASSNPYASASLYVGDLGQDVAEAQLFELFNTVGPVASIRVCREAVTRKSLGYAYVNFHGVADAERALDTMNFQQIKGRQCRIMWSQRDPRLRRSGKGNIFVKNLHSSIDNKTLYDTFSAFGGILSCKVAVDPSTGSSRGYGYVHFIEEGSALKAIEGVNGMNISGAEVSAETFRPRSYRERKLPFTNVYVKFIPPSLTEEGLVKLFEDEVLINDTKGNIDHSFYNAHERGIFACLNWDPKNNGAEYAKLSVELMNDFPIVVATGEAAERKDDGEKKDKAEADDEVMRIYVARAQEKSERASNLERQARTFKAQQKSSGANLYVKNLAPEVDDIKLREMFSQFGEITSAKVVMDPVKPGQVTKSRCFGFVAFKKKEDATRAMHDMTNRIEAGKPLYVSRAQTKDFREKYIQKQLRHKRRTTPFSNYPRTQPMYTQQFAPMMPPPPAMRPPYPMPPGRQPPPMQPPFYAMPGQFPPHFGPMPGQYPGQGFMPFSQINPVFSQHMQVPSVQQPNVMRQQPPQMMQGMRAQQVQQQQQHQQQQQQQGRQAGQVQSAATGPAPQSAATGRQNISSGAQVSLPQPTQPMASGQQFVRMGPGSQPTATSVPQQPASVSAVSTGHIGTSASQMDTQPLTVQMLQAAKPVERKRMIGERLFPKIQVVEPRLAGKITGMLLEMDNYELLILLSDQIALMNKINEALAVLKDHQQRHSQSNAASGQNSQQNQSAANRSSNKNMSQKNR